jgi:hypothetical protein
MSLPGLKSSFNNADLNAMQATAASGLNQFSNGVGQLVTTTGQVFFEATPIAAQVVDDTPKFEQFQIVVDNDRLSVRIGTVIWAKHNFGPDAEGNPTVSCGTQTLITEYARYTGDSVVAGTTNGGFMQEDGYVILST